MASPEVQATHVVESATVKRAHEPFIGSFTHSINTTQVSPEWEGLWAMQRGIIYKLHKLLFQGDWVHLVRGRVLLKEFCWHFLWKHFFFLLKIVILDFSVDLMWHLPSNSPSKIYWLFNKTTSLLMSINVLFRFFKWLFFSLLTKMEC